jgi:hypothetical protein
VKTTQRVVAALAALIMLGAVLSACSSRTTYAASPGYSNTYDVPPVYGQNNRCYYRDSPAEVDALRAAGLCSTRWAPYPMPSSWLDRYAGYYDSSDYYGRYVPPARRATYTRTVSTYVQSHPQAARQTRSVSQFGGGNGRTGGDYTSSRSTQTRRTSTGTSTRKSGSSFGGGSRGGRK